MKSMQYHTYTCESHPKGCGYLCKITMLIFEAKSMKSMHNHCVDFFPLFSQSQWSQCIIILHSYESSHMVRPSVHNHCLDFFSFLGKVNKINAISHCTHMNHPIWWDYQRTITMLIFSAFEGKSMKSTHNHYDQFFMFFRYVHLMYP